MYTSTDTQVATGETFPVAFCLSVDSVEVASVGGLHGRISTAPATRSHQEVSVYCEVWIMHLGLCSVGKMFTIFGIICHIRFSLTGIHGELALSVMAGGSSSEQSHLFAL